MSKESLNEARREFDKACDLWHLRRCTHIYMMAGWQNSRGARLERMKAREWGIEEMK